MKKILFDNLNINLFQSTDVIVISSDGKRLHISDVTFAHILFILYIYLYNIYYIIYI